MKLKLLLAALLVVLVPGLLWALAIAGYTLLLRQRFEASRDFQRKEADESAATIEAARKLLAGDPFLASGPADGADAAALLNSHLSWTQSYWDIWRSHTVPNFEVPAFFKPGFAWWVRTDVADPSTTENLDWMRELTRYEQWTLPLPEGPFNLARSVFPEPDYTGLQQVARERLRRGLSDGVPAQAAVETRALATLLFRTQRWRAVLAAASVLHMERLTYDAAVAAGTPLPATWQPWPEERIRALMALTLSTASALGPNTDAEHADAMLADTTSPVIQCAAKGEILEWLSMVRDVRDDALAPSLARARDWLDHPQGCRFEWPRLLWANGPLVKATDTAGKPTFERIDRIPQFLTAPLRGPLFLSGEFAYPGIGGYIFARSDESLWKQESWRE